MAKKSKIAKYQKQQLIERYAEKRYALKQAGDIEGLNLKGQPKPPPTVVMKSMVAQEVMRIGMSHVLSLENSKKSG